MEIKLNDKVERKWKPELGQGEVLHLIGESAVVRWQGTRSGNLVTPVVTIEERKYLKVLE